MKKKSQGLNQTDGFPVIIFPLKLFTTRGTRLTKRDSQIPVRPAFLYGKGRGKQWEESSDHKLLLCVLLCLIN